MTRTSLATFAYTCEFTRALRRPLAEEHHLTTMMDQQRNDSKALVEGGSEGRLDAAEDLVGRSRSVDRAVQSLCAVVIDERRGLLMVLDKPGLQCIGGVVTATHQWFTGYIVGHCDLRRVELCVVRASTLLVNQPSGYASDEQRVVDAEFNDGV